MFLGGHDRHHGPLTYLQRDGTPASRRRSHSLLKRQINAGVQPFNICRFRIRERLKMAECASTTVLPHCCHWRTPSKTKGRFLAPCCIRATGHYAQFATMSRSQEQSRGDSDGVLPLARSTSRNLYIVFPSESAAMHLQRAADEGNASGTIVKRRGVTHRHHSAVTGVMTKKRACSA